MLYVAAARRTDADASAAVRRLLAEAYAKITGEPMPALARAPGGKPFWPDSPWHLSLCHSRAAVLCAISDAPVGLDAEAMRPVRPEVVRRVLAPAELRCYDGTPEMFLRFWTLKEAYAKYTGEGIIGYPNRFVFHLTREGAELEGSDLRFSTVQQQGHIISVCTRAQELLCPQWCSEYGEASEYR